MKQTNLSRQVMQKIKLGKVKIRPKIYFSFEKFLLVSLLVMSIIISVLFINFIIYILSHNGAAEFLEFGYDGLAAFFENTPYGFVVWTLIFLGIAFWVYKKFDISYRRPVYSFTIVLLVISLGGGVGLATSGVNENLQDSLSQSNVPIINQAYSLAKVKNLKSNKGLIIKVEKIEDNTIIARASSGKMIVIKITKTDTNSDQNQIYNSSERQAALSTPTSISFGDPIADMRFKSLMDRHRAMVAQLNKIRTQQLQRIQEMEFQKGQVLKLIGKTDGDSYHTYDISPTKKQYQFYGTEEN